MAAAVRRIAPLASRSDIVKSESDSKRRAKRRAKRLSLAVARSILKTPCARSRCLVWKQVELSTVP